MSAESAIVASLATEEWLAATIHGLKCRRVDDRARLAMALFDLVHEYQSSINTLLQTNRSGAAFALVRPLWESFLRAYWLLHCATEEEVERFKQDQFNPRIAPLVEAVEAHIDDDGGVLTGIKERYYGAMSSYTHGAFMQAVRRIGDGEIGGDRFTDQERAEVATVAHAWALVAAWAMFLLAGRDDLAAETLDRVVAIPAVE